MTIERLTLNDPDAQSADPVAANVAALKALFPAAVADGRIDFDTLRQLLGDEVDDADERYGLNWPGKRQARRLALTPSTGTLRPAPEDSVDWETTRNLMIEGDNLEVLKLLQKSYAGKVKLIYIDPPYNTGNDFIYPDSFDDAMANYLSRTGQVGDDGVRNSSNPESSGRFHSQWLDMILPRLMLARELLAKDGVIMISSDETEVANLRAAADAAFGAECFVATLTVLCNPKGRSQDKYFATNHEYVTVYSKSSLEKGAFSVEKDEGQIEAEYTEEDELGKFRLLELRNTHREFGRFNRRDLYYPLYVAEDGSVSVEAKDGSTKVLPIWEDGFEGCWTWGKPKAEKDADFLVGQEVRGRMKVFRKSYASGADRMLKTILQDKSYITERGQREFNALFQTKAKIFQSPKSPLLLGDLLRTRTSGSDIVMDFFAGSGTTGHAVMQQNATDGATRRYILVQLPEPLDAANANQKAAASFCESASRPLTIAEITKERLRRAAAKVKIDNPGTEADLGFRVYKLATSNLRAWEPGEDLAADLLAAADNVVQGRSEEDLLTELLLKQGIDLTEPMLTQTIAGAPVHAMGGGVLVVCLAPVKATNAEALADGIADWIERLDPVAASSVFFKDTGFENDVAKANVAAILEQRLEDKLLKVRSL